MAVSVGDVRGWKSFGELVYLIFVRAQETLARVQTNPDSPCATEAQNPSLLPVTRDSVVTDRHLARS